MTDFMVAFVVDAKLLGPVVELLTDKRVRNLKVEAVSDDDTVSIRKTNGKTQVENLAELIAQHGRPVLGSEIKDSRAWERLGYSPASVGSVITTALEHGLIRVSKDTANKQSFRKYEAVKK